MFLINAKYAVSAKVLSQPRNQALRNSTLRLRNLNETLSEWLDATQSEFLKTRTVTFQQGIEILTMPDTASIVSSIWKWRFVFKVKITINDGF